jgi:hypothetical protein
LFKVQNTSKLDRLMFLSNLLLRYCDIRNNRHKYLFYFDNAPIHHARLLRPFYNHINVLFSPAYSPYLNPIEEYFSRVKFHFRTISLYEHDLLRAVIQSLCKVNETVIKHLYIHTFSYMLNCLDMVDDE